MHVLGIETATSIASVGLAHADQLVTVRSLPKGGSHARTVLPLIEAVLGAAGIGVGDLGLIAVSIGPGSFTGLRIGLSVAKGLALATSLPIVGVATLEAYAHTAGPRDGLVCPVLDARKGEVYGAAYRVRGADRTAVVEPAAMSPDQFASLVEVPCTLIGDGVDAHAALWRRLLGARAEILTIDELPPSGATVAQLGFARARDTGGDDLTALEPRYCRLAEAEVVRARRSRAPGETGDGSPFIKLTGGRA